MRQISSRLALLGALSWATAGAAAPLKGVQTQAALRPEGSALRAGRTVAFDGEWAFLGAPDSDEFGLGVGAVYVFRLLGGEWVQQATIRPVNPQPNDHFGAALSLDQGRLAVARSGPQDGEAGGVNTALSVWHLNTQAQTWEPEPVELFLESTTKAEGITLSLKGEFLAASSVESQMSRLYHLETSSNAFWAQEAVDGGPSFAQATLDATDATRMALTAGGDVRLYSRLVDASGPRWVEDKVLTQATKLALDCRLARRGDWVMVNCPGSGGYVKFLRTDGSESALFQATGGTAFEHALVLGDGRAAVIESKKGEQRVRFFAFDGSAWGDGGSQVTSAQADETGGLALRESGAQAQLLVGRPGESRTGVTSGDGVFWRSDAGGWGADPTLPALGARPYIGSRFGAALALDGNTLVVGLPRASDYDPNLSANAELQPETGRVHVYSRDDASSPWKHVQTLRSPGLSAGARFGSSLVLGETILAVGAPADGPDSFLGNGTVYLYARQTDNPAEPIKPNALEDLSPSLSEVGAMGPTHFGATLALEFTTSEPSPGGLLVVGAPSSQYLGSTPDVGFVFSYPLDVDGETNGHSKWSTGAQQPARFGESVAVRGSRILVGAPGTTASGASNGAVYDINTMTPGDQKLFYLQQGPSPTDNRFGTRMALQGDRLLVSSVGAGVEQSVGTVSLHRYDATKQEWAYTQRLGGDAVQGGQQLALDADLALVTEGASGARVVRVYLNEDGANGGDAWKAQIGLTRPGSSPLFGGALALQASSRQALVGDPGDDSVSAWGLREAQGAPCASDADCNADPVNGPSLTCVDGVCCGSPCGGGADDCQACSQASGGSEDGVCTPLAEVPATPCQAATACSAAAFCQTSSDQCPAPAPLPDTTECVVDGMDGRCDGTGQCVASGAGGVGGAGGMSGASGQGGEATVPDLWVGVDKGTAGAPASAGGSTSAGGQGGAERPPEPDEAVAASGYPDEGCSAGAAGGSGRPGALLGLFTALSALAGRRRRAA